MSWYVLCVAGAASLTLLGPAAPNGSGALSRQVVLLACVAVYVFRAAQTLFVFVKRRVPWWEAIWGGSIIGCVLFFFLLGGLRTSQPIGAIDIVGVLLYIGGSYIGTAAERSRHVWKARAESQGHLYTHGLFKYSRHINYFGDLLVFGGLGMLSGSSGRPLCLSPWV